MTGRLWIRLMLLVLGFSPVWFLLPTKEDALRPVLERALRITDEEQQLIDLTNQERAKEELRPLKPHPLLMQAAREHAANMARQQKIEHVLDGKEPRDRVRGVGYRFRHLGENVASGYRSPEAVVRGWMSSEGHRGNILRAEFTEIGVGVVRDHSGKPYYAQVLASPK